MTEFTYLILLAALFFTTVFFLFLYVKWRWKYKQLLKKSLRTSEVSIELVETFSFVADSVDSATENRILNDLYRLFEEEKIYLNSQLTIGELAKLVGVSKSVLSRIINAKAQRNFPTLLNEYRVKEAVRLLKDPKAQNYKMEIIAEMCGYRNRQVFHSAFKRCVGVTPIQFRDMTKTEVE